MPLAVATDRRDCYASPMPLRVATLNVLDLLEPHDDAERAVLPAKLDWIARTLRACDADVVGLQEVGPVELVRGIVERIGGAAVGWGEPVMGTADQRGIRCALLSRLPVTGARVHTAEALDFPVFVRGDPPPFGRRIPLRRGVVQARVEAPGLGPVEVLVAHFKSPRPVPLRTASGAELEATTARARAEGVLRSLAWRASEALHVRGLVDAVLAERADAHVVVIGDLNDVPDSPALRAVRGEGPGAMLDCTAGVDPAARYSVLHGGRRAQIDHALATAGLYARLAAARFLNAELRDHAGDRDRPAEMPPATGPAPGAATASARGLPPAVDSDHAALVVGFQ
jgi:endonuclease/exonuclease/phosphatase family metal-dependent hydrolase